MCNRSHHMRFGSDHDSSEEVAFGNLAEMLRKPIVSIAR